MGLTQPPITSPRNPRANSARRSGGLDMRRQRILTENLVENRSDAIGASGVGLDGIRHGLSNSFRDLSQVIHASPVGNFAEINVLRRTFAFVFRPEQSNQGAFPFSSLRLPCLYPFADGKRDFVLRSRGEYQKVGPDRILGCFLRALPVAKLLESVPVDLELVLDPKALNERVAKLPGPLPGSLIIVEYR